MSPKQIRALRKDLELTQQQLADWIAAQRVTVARWEIGTSRPTGAYLKSLLELREKAKIKKSKGGWQEAQVSESGAASVLPPVRDSVRGLDDALLRPVCVSSQKEKRLFPLGSDSAVAKDQLKKLAARDVDRYVSIWTDSVLRPKQK
jgi:transcriptional regulator with XRE-family HTH domain